MISLKKERLILINFLILFLFFWGLYIFFVYNGIETKNIIRLLLFTFYFFVIFLSKNPIKYLILSVPIVIIFALRIWFNYIVIPSTLKIYSPKILLHIYIYDIFTPFIVIFLAAIKLTNVRFKRKIPPPIKLFFIYIFFALFSTLWSKKPDFSLLNFIIMFSNIIYFLMGYQFITEERDFRLFLFFWIFFLIFNIIVALFQRFWGSFPFLKLWSLPETRSFIWKARIQGIFNHSNSFSAFLSISFSLIIGTLLTFKFNKTLKYLMFVVLLILIFLILSSYSRTGYLSLIMLGYLYIISYFYYKKSIKQFLKYNLIFLMFLGAGVVLLKVFFPFIFLRFESMLWFHRDPSINFRFVFWQESIRQFISHPLTGIGFGQFTFLPVSLTHTHAHNAFFHNLCELGLLGTLLILIILLYPLIFFYKKIKERDKNYWIYASFFISWILIIFIHFNFDYFWLSVRNNMENKVFFSFFILSLITPEFLDKGDKSLD